MSDSCSTYKPLLTEALFGELDEADRERLDAHLDDCPECAAELQALTSTLDLASEYRHPERPEAYWTQFTEHVHERAAGASSPASAGASAAAAAGEASAQGGAQAGAQPPSLLDRARSAWREWTSVSGGAWALQAAVAALLIVVGLSAGRWTASTDAPPGLPGEGSADLQLLPASTDWGSDAQAQPALAGIEDVTYDVSTGTVEIRYNTVSDVVVRGRPGDPKIQQLLQAALLDEGNPASRLHAVKTLEASRATPNAEVVQALTYVAHDDGAPHMRLRAVRALRQIHERAPLADETRSVLVSILVDDADEADAALRIEALKALTDEAARTPTGTVPAYLYEARRDSNGYVRYQAEQMLQSIQSER
jgi:anti-sigma factor RsiW